MRVFISRSLAPDASFRNLLQKRGLSVTGVPMVILSALPFPIVPSCDWVFFSSKNAVKFFFQHEANQKRIEQLKWAAIGPTTAKAIATYCPKIDFIGTGDPEETAKIFEPLAINQNVLFPSAQQSRGGVQQFLSSEVQAIPLKIYDNQPLPHPELRTEDALVFTSPMSAEAYFSVHVLQQKQRVIAIGNSTLSTLQMLGIERVVKASNTTEEAMAVAVFACLGV